MSPIVSQLLRDIQEVARPVSASALAAAIRQTSDVYNRRGSAAWAPGAIDLQARLQFFLPRDLLKPASVLGELLARGALPSSASWRVLDLGAGLGAMTFGTAVFAAESEIQPSLDVTAVDRDPEALRIFEALARRPTWTNLELKTVVASLPTLPPLNTSYDLILLGLVLNELPHGPAERAAFLQRLAAHLTPHGAIVIIEPGLKAASRELQATRDAIVAATDAGDTRLHVFAPCLRGGSCPMLARGPRDWCHHETDVSLPEPVAGLARSAGLRDQRLTFSYLVLRRETARPKAENAENALRVVSSLRRTKGKREVFVCGEPGLLRLVRLDRHRSPANADLDRVGRGTIVSVTEASQRKDRLEIGATSRTKILFEE